MRLRARGAHRRRSPRQEGCRERCRREGVGRSRMASSVPGKGVAPQELAFGQCLVELGDQVQCNGCREGGDQT